MKDSKCGNVEYNFVLSNGTSSILKNNRQLTEVRIQPEGVAVKKIIIWYHESDALLTGFQLFAIDGTKLFETGWTGGF